MVLLILYICHNSCPAGQVIVYKTQSPKNNSDPFSEHILFTVHSNQISCFSTDMGNEIAEHRAM